MSRRQVRKRLGKCGQEEMHFGPREHHGQNVRLGDPHLAKDSPGAELQTLQIEGAQSELHRFHGCVLVVLVLVQEQELLAELVLGKRGGIALKMLGRLAEVANIFLFGGQAIIFEIDALLELNKRRIVIHIAAKMLSSEGVRPAKSRKMQKTPDFFCPRSGSVQQIAAANAGWRFRFRFAIHLV